jgi:hypothetical protein
VVIAIMLVAIFLDAGAILKNKPLVIQRLLEPLETRNAPETLLNERHYTEQAWNTVREGAWFIGGYPDKVLEWIKSALYVPHNSLLDIGIAFGRASFYSYASLLLGLIIANIRYILLLSPQRNWEQPEIGLTQIIFYSLLPMYMTLSAGFRMDFIMWIALGAYPFLHVAPRFRRAKSARMSSTHATVIQHRHC